MNAVSIVIFVENERLYVTRQPHLLDNDQEDRKLESSESRVERYK